MRFSIDQPEKEGIYVVKTEKSSGRVIDFFMVSMFIIITVALIATYFIEFDMDADFNIKKATTQTLWFALGTFCVGELSKRIFRRKGEKTEEFITAEKEACAAIKSVNELGAEKAAEYCTHATTEVVKRFRKHNLLAVGISLEKYEKEYLGKGAVFLFKQLKKGELSYIQAKTIWRCNKAKIKPYDPRFITSYNSEDRFDRVPSEQHNTRKADINNTIQKFIFSLGTAFGVGFIFHDVVINFSAEMLFVALVKIIAMAIGCCLNASFGWNLSIMDIRRNKLRQSEAQACIAYIASEGKKNVGAV
jgi:ABC-type multidrug transport system fused ATPase/permease subunit